MNKVIVAGSINQDIVVFSKSHPKIGETILGLDIKYFPGGKGANQAVASAKFGAKTLMLGKVGNDVFGRQLVAFLNQQSVETRVSVDRAMPTGIAIITVAEETANNTIVVVPGANFALAEDNINNVNFEKGDVLVSQFEIPIKTIVSFFKKGREVGATNILNPAPAQIIPKNLLSLVDILVLNETELNFISGMSADVTDDNSIKGAVNRIKHANLAVVVTIGSRGVVMCTDENIIRIPGREVKAIDTTGAGDCFVGVLAASITKGYSLTESIGLANIAASISVTREGAGPSMPSMDEVSALI